MIALDTSILIWGVRKQPDTNRPDLVERCERLIAKLKESHIPIMLPSVTVAEYLTGFDEESQKRQREIIGNNFFIAPFDGKAAAITAELYNKALIDESRRQAGVGKQCIKADLEIIATAIAHGASHLYADDKQFTSLAQGRILIKDIPPLQLNLPGLSFGND